VLRVFGIVLVVLGGTAAMLALSGAAYVGFRAAPCPPGATCDGEALLTALAMMLGLGGVVAAAVGGVLAALAGKAPPSR